MSTHEARLAHVRTILTTMKLDGFVVPLTDAHLSEYVGDDAKRLEWLTGFAGSAGSAVILGNRAGMFVDGRYTLQVRDQVDGTLYDYLNVPETSPADWIAAHAPAGARIGYDPWLHTAAWVQQMRATLARHDITLVRASENPVDRAWVHRPAASLAPAVPHAIDHAGVDAAEKRQMVADWLVREACDAVVICALDSIAWLFNMRGSDVTHTPVAQAFALVRADATADLFIAPEKVTDGLRAHLGEAVWLHPYDGFTTGLAALAGKRVAVDPERAVAAIHDALSAAEIVPLRDPVVLPKAIKNRAEIEGTRAAHIRDGAALSRFLHWMSPVGDPGPKTELSAANQLETFRRETNQLCDLSFDTISGSGPNGAVIHYRVTEATNRPITPNSAFLVDSGGQYLDGTTDVTRTLWMGPDAPDDTLRDRFTRVLKGHIALAQAVFPRGTSGAQLDTLARQFLWSAGLDYAHGTGHGVGSFLAVHEGPQRIAKPAGGQAGTSEPLRPGMILSNEPGYYLPGAYGIRIENLVLVVDAHIDGAEGAFLGFETLTLAPIERALILPELLTPAEKAWLDAYHARVFATLAPMLPDDARGWLEQACAPLH